mmetsp:Transcript_31477/g.86592  ORF Transcript_31477/g.86592 Transcript_31477/m.86592 type:complete len:256 (-) Transcript_31477:415-1182(-)
MQLHRPRVVNLAHQQAHRRGDWHREDGACRTPNCAPERQRNDNGQRMQVQACRHELGLHQATQEVVDDEGHRDRRNNVPHGLCGVEQHDGQGGEDGEQRANVGNVIQEEGEETEEHHEVDAKQCEGEHHECGNDEIVDRLEDQVPLQKDLDPGARSALGLVDTGHHGDETKEKHQQREHDALRDRQELRDHIQGVLLEVMPERARLQGVGAYDAHRVQGVDDFLQLLGRPVLVPCEGRERRNERGDHPGDRAKQQ